MAVPLILGALFSAGSALIGGASRRRARRAQARAARLNARQVRERTEIQSTLRQREGTREAGRISAAAGASNLAGGSAADILRESARNTAFDVASIESQGELQAQVFEQEARGAQRSGNLAALGSAFTAGAILLGG